MPRRAVQRAVAQAGDPPETLPGVSFVAHRLHVPVHTAIHRLKNLDYLDLHTHDELIERLGYERTLGRR